MRLLVARIRGRIGAARVLGWRNVVRCSDSAHIAGPVWHHKDFHKREGRDAVAA